MARRPARAKKAPTPSKKAPRNIMVAGKRATKAQLAAGRKLARREGISLGAAVKRVANASRVRGTGAAVNNRPRFDRASAAISAEAGNFRAPRTRRERLALAQ